MPAKAKKAPVPPMTVNDLENYLHALNANYDLPANKAFDSNAKCFNIGFMFTYMDHIDVKFYPHWSNDNLQYFHNGVPITRERAIELIGEK